MLRRMFAVSSHPFYGRVRWLLVSGALLAGAFSTSPVLAAPPEGSYRGNAWGTFASADAGQVAATLGRSALVTCGCRGTDGRVVSNRVDSISAGRNGRVLTLDVVVATAFTDELANQAVIRTTARAEGLNMFKGLIKAEAIKVRANATATATDIDTNATGTHFVGLRVAGHLVEDSVAPNTKFALPGIGSVTVNKITRESGSGFRIITIEGLVVKIEAENDFNLPVGVEIIVAHARAGFTRKVPEVVVGGSAWATQANATIGDVLANRIGRAALVTVGCEGTHGRIKSNNIAELDVGRVLSLGTGKTTGFGDKTATGSIVKTTAKVQDVLLLNGAVRADAVIAVAQESVSGGSKTRSTQGSGFVKLRVNGVLQPINTPPNTVILLPAFGRVVLNEQTIPPPGSSEPTKVNGIVIIITKANTLNLPIGSRIVVAHATARAHLFENEPVETSEDELRVAETAN
jgi:hypothetical protein